MNECLPRVWEGGSELRAPTRTNSLLMFFLFFWWGLAKNSGLVGLLVQVDQRVFDGADGSGRVPPVLPHALHRVGRTVAAQNGGPVAQLRGPADELPRQSRHAPTAHQDHAAQAVQAVGQSLAHQQVRFPSLLGRRILSGALVFFSNILFLAVSDWTGNDNMNV